MNAATYDEVMISLGLEPSSPPRGRPHGTGTGRKSVECGTYSGYMRHKQQLREDACDACLEAKREYERERYAANRERINARRRKGGAR